MLDLPHNVGFIHEIGQTENKYCGVVLLCNNNVSKSNMSKLTQKYDFNMKLSYIVGKPY